MSATLPSPADPLQQILDDTRHRFIASFAGQCDSIRIHVDMVATLGPEGPIAALRQLTHRLSGLAGTIGFPTISARASELEALIDAAGTTAFSAVAARNAVDAICGAYTVDLANPPVWASPAPKAVHGSKILIAEDDADQRAIVTICLTAAGYAPVAVVSGDLVVQAARDEKPALILLDVAMPNLDGYSACRLLKADPELADIPVIFMTSRSTYEDKLIGLTIGAEEFLTKPVDLRELVLRIRLLMKRRDEQRATAEEPCASKELTYDAFLSAANAAMIRSAVALAIFRLPAERHDECVRSLGEEIRSRDTIGAYGLTRALILMPDMTAAAASTRVELMADRLAAENVSGICVGVTASSAARVSTAEALITQAAEALAEARYLGDKSAIWKERTQRPAAAPAARIIVLAEDDPDVTHIVDAQVRAAGHKVFIAFDGEQALAAVRAHSPDVLVLDLMMPKLSGFEVLTQLGQTPDAPRPKVIVLSGRGREPDVMRAFELGADDYMTKPFNPQELMARIARLLK
jgi:DNA-binding response OmpR family regulator